MSTLSEKSARDLQWHQVLERISRYCATDLAEEEITRLLPAANLEDARIRQKMAAEALHLCATAPLPIQRFARLDELWARLAKGTSGSAEQLRDTAKLIELSAALRRYLAEHREHCPTLKAELWTSPELDALGNEIQRAIDENAEVRDSASKTLHAARTRLAAVRRRLRSTQQSLLKKYADALSGQFFAEREGRLVLPVRADRIGSVRGIVFGSSGSGGTLYVEPNELTQPNNALRVAEAEVSQEVARVLAELCGRAALLLDELKAAERACVRADCQRAITHWASECNALPIEFDPEPMLDLKQVRHPLLTGASVVANDIRLESGHCLIISGPNAGGKTVAMKCLGLSVLLSRSGLPVPLAAGSRVGWFDEVFTDIGDDQSLSRSLSTFSAHIQNIANSLEQVGNAALEPHSGPTLRRALVLLDELAGGTDPEEGSALAAAVLHAFVARGAAVAVTTHYDKLKQLGASENERFHNASVGFDMEALKPTFQLALGTPGASSAFSVALRFGIPAAVVDQARQFLPKDQQTQEELLAQLERERQRLSQAREQAEDELSTQTRLTRELQDARLNAKEREQARLQREATQLTQEIKQARALLEVARDKLNHAQPDKAELKRVQELLTQASAPIGLEGTLTSALKQPATTGKAPTLDQLSPGTAVFLTGLQTQGEVVDISKKGNVRVSVRGLKMAVPLSQLRLAPISGKSRLNGSKKQQKQSAPSSVEGFTPARTSSNTCDLRGQRVDAGLDRVDEFIDQMFQQNEHAAYILHGHGTGAMKSAVREHLASSPHVTHWEVPPREDGGDALTLFWLRG